MALRDDLLPVIDSARQLVQDFGLRQVRVWMRRGQWDGGEIHLGELVNGDTEIVPRPKVVEQGPRLRVTKVTPAFTGGGFSPSDLQPSVEAAADFHFVVMKPDGALRAYYLADISTEKNFSYELTLAPIDATSPDNF